MRLNLQEFDSVPDIVVRSRSCIRRTLEACGYLMYQRRRIPHTFPAQKRQTFHRGHISPLPIITASFGRAVLGKAYDVESNRNPLGVRFFAGWTLTAAFLWVNFMGTRFPIMCPLSVNSFAKPVGIALAILVAAAFSPSQARAECGDYVHIASQASNDAGQGKSIPTPQAPCNGPN